MAQFGTLVTPGSQQTLFIQASLPADLAIRVNAAIAQIPIHNRVLSLSLAGAGDCFVCTLQHASAADVLNGQEPATMSVAAFLASEQNALRLAAASVHPFKAVIAYAIAGAGGGFMGLLVQATPTTPTPSPPPALELAPSGDDTGKVNTTADSSVISFVAAPHRTSFERLGAGVAIWGAGDDYSLTPQAPPAVSRFGSSGATEYSYSLVKLQDTGAHSAASDVAVLVAGAALDSENYNALSWTNDDNAEGYAVYRDGLLVAILGLGADGWDDKGDDSDQYYTRWRANYAYSPGDRVAQSDTEFFRCIAAVGDRVSGSVEPAWRTGLGDTTTDGDVTWRKEWLGLPPDAPLTPARGLFKSTVVGWSDIDFKAMTLAGAVPASVSGAWIIHDDFALLKSACQAASCISLTAGTYMVVLRPNDLTVSSQGRKNALDLLNVPRSVLCESGVRVRVLATGTVSDHNEGNEFWTLFDRVSGCRFCGGLWSWEQTGALWHNVAFSAYQRVVESVFADVVFEGWPVGGHSNGVTTVDGSSSSHNSFRNVRWLNYGGAVGGGTDLTTGSGPAHFAHGDELLENCEIRTWRAHTSHGVYTSPGTYGLQLRNLRLQGIPNANGVNVYSGSGAATGRKEMVLDVVARECSNAVYIDSGSSGSTSTSEIRISLTCHAVKTPLFARHVRTMVVDVAQLSGNSGGLSFIDVQRLVVANVESHNPRATVLTLTDCYDVALHALLMVIDDEQAPGTSTARLIEAGGTGARLDLSDISCTGFVLSYPLRISPVSDGAITDLSITNARFRSSNPGVAMRIGVNGRGVVRGRYSNVFVDAAAHAFNALVEGDDHWFWGCKLPDGLNSAGATNVVVNGTPVP